MQRTPPPRAGPVRAHFILNHTCFPNRPFLRDYQFGFQFKKPSDYFAVTRSPVILVFSCHDLYFHVGIMSAANSTRSSSISSASPAAGRNDGPKKKFVCSWQNCGKSFSRSEHLHRHALNHKDGNNTCPRCSAHFRRRDLLGMMGSRRVSIEVLYAEHRTLNRSTHGEA
jgi:uncharacterized Zn-finger protein